MCAQFTAALVLSSVDELQRLLLSVGSCRPPVWPSERVVTVLLFLTTLDLIWDILSLRTLLMKGQFSWQPITAFQLQCFL